MVTELDAIVRLVVSFMLGGIIGRERQSRRKSAGFRTHILVCLGSCLIMILSQNIYGRVQGFTNADPARLAAQVVSGIGFLGAGTIMKEGLSIRGLTTAASLWTVSGIGLAVGFGEYLCAGVTTFLSYLALTLLSHWEIKSHFRFAHIQVTSIDRPGQIGKVTSLVGRYGLNIMDIRVEDAASGHVIIYITVDLCGEVNIGELICGLKEVEGVSAVRDEQE